MYYNYRSEARLEAIRIAQKHGWQMQSSTPDRDILIRRRSSWQSFAICIGNDGRTIRVPF